jgi:hypothetical protein
LDASEEGGPDSGEGLSVGVTRVSIVSPSVSEAAKAERRKPRREAISRDGGRKKSLLAQRSWLVSEGVKRKKETAVNARASADCGTSMTSAKKS